VLRHVCYDDLDPKSLDTGIVVFRSTGFSALWTLCRDLSMDVLADVHTHGNAAPRQSAIDRANPMIARIGHIAFVLPRFATLLCLGLRNVAVAEYMGDYEWHDWTGKDVARRVRLTWRWK